MSVTVAFLTILTFGVARAQDGTTTPTPPPMITHDFFTEAPTTTEMTTAAPHNVACYSCQYVHSVDQCNHGRRCSSDEVCLYGSVEAHGRNSYYLDCIPKAACDSLEPLFATSGSVTYLGKTFSQFQCCNQDKCNKILASQNVSPVGCQDSWQTWRDPIAEVNVNDKERQLCIGDCKF